MSVPLNVVIYMCAASFALGVLLLVLIVMLTETRKDFSGVGAVSKSKVNKCNCDGCNMEYGYQPCHKNEPDFTVTPPTIDMNGQ